VKLIYCGYFGTYGAYLAAYIHAGGVVDNIDILSYHEFCQKYAERFGNMIYIGMDKGLREIYALGCKEYCGVIKRAQTGVNEMFHIGEALYYIDVTTLDDQIPKIVQSLDRHGCLHLLSHRLFCRWFYDACKKGKDIVHYHTEYLEEMDI
jgi:hypothetical protein